MEVGAEGVMNVGMLAGGLAVGVEASRGGEPEGMSGDTRPLGVVWAVARGGDQAREKVQKYFLLGLGLER